MLVVRLFNKRIVKVLETAEEIGRMAHDPKHQIYSNAEVGPVHQADTRLFHHPPCLGKVIIPARCSNNDRKSRHTGGRDVADDSAWFGKIDADFSLAQVAPGARDGVQYCHNLAAVQRGCLFDHVPHFPVPEQCYSHICLIERGSCRTTPQSSRLSVPLLRTSQDCRGIASSPSKLRTRMWC